MLFTSTIYPSDAMAPVANGTLHSNGTRANGAHTNGTHVVHKHPHAQLGFGTRAIHVGSEANAETGAVIPPISLSTTYKQHGIGNHKVRAPHTSPNSSS